MTPQYQALNLKLCLKMGWKDFNGWLVHPDLPTAACYAACRVWGLEV